MPTVAADASVAPRAGAFVAADAFVGEAAFVEAVGLEKALVEVADCHLRHIFNNERAQLGEHHLGQQATLGLDLAGDGEAVPEGFAEAITKQHPALFDARNLFAIKQR
jgi:hypothetical protein